MFIISRYLFCLIFSFLHLKNMNNTETHMWKQKFLRLIDDGRSRKSITVASKLAIAV